MSHIWRIKCGTVSYFCSKGQDEEHLPTIPYLQPNSSLGCSSQNLLDAEMETQGPSGLEICAEAQYSGEWNNPAKMLTPGKSGPLGSRAGGAQWGENSCQSRLLSCHRDMQGECQPPWWPPIVCSRPQWILRFQDGHLWFLWLSAI